MCDILVVEDEDTMRMVVDMLEDDGFQAREAATLAEALRAASESPGCLVLVTDIT
ncbi:hypothetical protein [Roseomonas harenae]|uniref:hypothetical protein n=1 Tax=Muricoccus harenae TaxID=2692566 RepID=UPI001331214A|nr:hypothetical protein [Roseomonas harenae]